MYTSSVTTLVLDSAEYTFNYFSSVFLALEFRRVGAHSKINYELVPRGSVRLGLFTHALAKTAQTRRHTERAQTAIDSILRYSPISLAQMNGVHTHLTYT